MFSSVMTLHFSRFLRIFFFFFIHASTFVRNTLPMQMPRNRKGGNNDERERERKKEIKTKKPRSRSQDAAVILYKREPFAIKTTHILDWMITNPFLWTLFFNLPSRCGIFKLSQCEFLKIKMSGRLREFPVCKVKTPSCASLTLESSTIN